MAVGLGGWLSQRWQSKWVFVRGAGGVRVNDGFLSVAAQQ
ncbi:hypothetical protein SNOG_13220 [Parastagonospora nodorum SN15]|uniref:Uncharacterized protein n=1 Tax=Phaeosphaeria nodorum (strain SN15 / ATCC MYA-4574 / FGSC 10173) TaxID=321614 RepID=Q0U4U4_PHANO|nr:hypothetical protein SNOG_13220 [Parastagonospora nodorum SN15]EAT79547.1 hypothetical protein SNOG_13220 [Parastagonospora nodorum SN15]